MDYLVDLQMFRGPLDLLLFLVKREEVDVLDIPIARIAEQFLHYLEVLQVIDVERAGDFLIMASTLMEIKSKLLLPRTAEEAEEEDPRSELVRQLLEYKRFKDAAVLLEQQAEEQALRFPRQPMELTPAPVDAAQQPIRHVELWDLVSAFGRLLRETLSAQPKQIIYDETPIHVHVAGILARLADRPRLGFAEVFDPPWTRGRLVGLFLALLELIKAQRIRVQQETPFADIWVELAPDSPADNGGKVPG